MSALGLRETLSQFLAGGQKSAAIMPSHSGNTPADLALDLDGVNLQITGMGPEQLWRTQPHLRILVTFLARNIAQLGLHTFQRVSDTDRRRLRDDPVALLFGRPNPNQTAYELIYGLVADLALYDVAYWAIGTADSPSGFSLTALPPAWTTAHGGNLLAPGYVVVKPPNGTTETKIDASSLLIFHGWNPDKPYSGSSPIEALRSLLQEQIHAWAYRNQVWERGGRASSVITRPADAPMWSPDAQDRFKADWQARWAGDGPNAGGTPILQDGMTLSKMSFSAREDDWVNVSKLSLATVASVYHVNPTMVGLLDNANYSNVREFRRMLYGDTLGPVMAQIEDRVNTFLVPRVTGTAGVYVEFNIGEKLQGSFEEQAAALQSATGRPWMTANEARAKVNLPALPDEDANSLITPMNVTVGGQASPTDSAPKSRSVLVKARADEYDSDAEKTLRKFFKRQQAVVLSAIGAKDAGDWWDGDRWDAELATDLYVLALGLTKTVSAAVLKGAGEAPDLYDVERTVAWLKAVVGSRAANINQATKTQIDDALKGGAAPADVFTKAGEIRAPSSAVSLVSAFSGFATTEVARQRGGDTATKTWETGPKARLSHASMNGETVGIDESFSNGLNWPGDYGNADEVAGCNCSCSVSWEAQ